MSEPEFLRPPEVRPRRASQVYGGQGSVIVIVATGTTETASSPGQKAHVMDEQAPDGGFGWMIVFAVFMIHVVVDGVSYSFGVIFPELLTQFKGSKSETSWILSVLIGTTYTCAPLPGFLALRFGRRPVAFAGAVLACAGALLSCFATELWHLTLTFGFLTGLGFGFLYLPAVVSVATWFRKWRALAMGIAVCGTGLGTMALAPLAEYLLDACSIAGCLMIYAGIIFNACVFAALLRPTASETLASRNPPPKMIVLEEHELDSLPVSCSQKAGKVLILAKVLELVKANLNADVILLKDWRFLLFCMSAFFGGVSGYIPYTYLPHRAETEVKSVDKAAAAELVTFMGFGNLFGRLFSSAVCDRAWLNRPAAYSVSWLVAGLATCLSILCVNYAMFVVYAVVYSFCFGFIIALHPVVISDIVGLERLTSAFGLLLFIEGAAVFVGPPIAGAITDYDGNSYTVAFVVFGTLMLIAGSSILIIPGVKWFSERAKLRRE